MSKNVSNERVSILFTLLTVLVKASHFCPKHVYYVVEAFLASVFDSSCKPGAVTRGRGFDA